MADTTPDFSGTPSARRVGNYEILDEIGAGGMSRVYRGRRIGTGEIVAVKAMQIENMAPDFEARLRREPEIQGGIGHENIVRLVESFRERDEFFLVMEYIDGRSLARMIHRETGPLPFDHARRYMRQILRALEHLHHIGIVHRDIKPSNILIGWNDVAKLADFGIAKFAWQQAQTSTQRGLGTPEYMSPEQARGQQLDYRSDIYSLGITLYEALTGRRPFARAEATPAAYGEVIQEILTRPLPDPRTFNPAITPEMVRLLAKATAKDPADRFQSCAEFLGALEIVEAGPVPGTSRYEPEPSAPTVTAARPAEPPRAGERPLANEPQGSPPTAGAFSQGAQSGPRVTMPADAPSARSAWPWVLLGIIVVGVGGYFLLQWYQRTYGTEHLTDAGAMKISKSVADDVKRFTMDANAPGLASLFDSAGVEFFKLKNTTRKAVQDEINKLMVRVVRTEKYDIEVRRARALNDSTIETEWVITYQRMRNDSTLLRGSTSNIVRLEKIDDQWLIVSETEKWTKRDNVAPPKPTVDSTAAADSVEVVDLNHGRSQPDRETRIATFRMFLGMVIGDGSSQAWELYATPALRASADRDRFAGEISGKGFELRDVTADGDPVTAVLVRTGTDGAQETVRVVGTVVDDNGTPKVATVRTD